MPAINFRPEFVDAVENGTKRQTIRRRRKQPIKKGDRLQLYTGMRTKQCRRLATTACVSVQSIVITEAWVMLGGSYVDLDKLAKDDGFCNWAEMRDFFSTQYGLPFVGVLIRW